MDSHTLCLLTISGKQITLTPDTLQKQTLILKRKYPPLENIYKVAERIVGGKFQIATDSLFEDSITVNTIKELGIYAKEVDLSQGKDSAQYCRYYYPKGAYCTIAELYFYEQDSIRPTMGKIIGTEGSYRNDTKYRTEGAFDRDALAFIDSQRHCDC